LLAGGHAVTILDDFSTGREVNIAHLRGDARLQIIRDSVENAATVNLAVAGCDAIFHLASAVGVQLIVDEPVRTIRSIIHGTEVVLEAAQRFGRPVLITSSSEVYGKGSRVPFAEDDDVVVGPTLSARWCYSYAKGVDEFLGLAYHRQFGLPVTLVRLFNTVGPRQVGMYGMVLPRFVAAALASKPLQVYGDGTQTRCFCHVSDVVDALLRLFAVPEAVGRVFNLGSNEEISMAQLARKVIAICQSNSTIVYVPLEQVFGQKFDDMPRRVPALSRIAELIGFKPRVRLEQIIESVRDYQKEP